MAKRVIDDSTLTAIAEPVRSIMGLSDLLSPAAMASNLVSADGEVTNQEALIAELQELLEGKAGGVNVKASCGSITFATTNIDTSEGVLVEHGLGEKPTAFCLGTTTSSGGSNTLRVFASFRGEYNDYYVVAVKNSSAGGNDAYYKSTFTDKDFLLDEKYARVIGYNASTVAHTQGYKWFAVSNGEAIII